MCINKYCTRSASSPNHFCIDYRLPELGVGCIQDVIDSSLISYGKFLPPDISVGYAQNVARRNSRSELYEFVIYYPDGSKSKTYADSVRILSLFEAAVYKNLTKNV